MSHSLTPTTHPELADHERQRCEVWTRVMGYHRPKSSFNIGKQGEFGERRYFDEPGTEVRRAARADSDADSHADTCTAACAGA